VWIIEYHQSTALYRIDNCSECTPPITAKWECFQGGLQPTPSIEYQAFCNIIISKASNTEVNGVYNPVDEAVGGLPVWVKLGIPEFRIQWSLDSAAWVLRDTEGTALYSCEDIQYIRTDDPGQLNPKSAYWVRCKTAEELAEEEEEDEDGLASCLGRSSSKAKKASEGQPSTKPISARTAPKHDGPEHKGDAHDDDIKKNGSEAAPARDLADVRKKRHVEAVAPLPAVEENPNASTSEKGNLDVKPVSANIETPGAVVPVSPRDDQHRRQEQASRSTTTVVAERKSVTPPRSPTQTAADSRKKPNIPPLRMPASEPVVVKGIESSHVGSDTSASLPVTPAASDMPKIRAQQVSAPPPGSAPNTATLAKKSSKILSAKVVSQQATPKGSPKKAGAPLPVSPVMSPLMSPAVPLQTPNMSVPRDRLSHTAPQLSTVSDSVMSSERQKTLPLPHVVSPVLQSQAPQIMSPVLQKQTAIVLTQENTKSSSLQVKMTASPLSSPVSSVTVKPGLSEAKTGSMEMQKGAAIGSYGRNFIGSNSSALGSTTLLSSPPGSLPPSKSPSVAGSFVGSPAMPITPGNQLIGSQRLVRSTSIPPALQARNGANSASAAYQAYRASQGLPEMASASSPKLSRPQSVKNLPTATPLLSYN
jgi:hypothetical protein